MGPTDSTALDSTLEINRKGTIDDDKKLKGIEEIENPSKNSEEKKKRKGFSNLSLVILSLIFFAASGSGDIAIPFIGFFAVIPILSIIPAVMILNELSHRVFGKSLIALGKSFFNIINEKRKERQERKQKKERSIGPIEKVVGKFQVGQTCNVLEQKTIQTQAPSSTSIN
jgi:hypothetical protein